jgi:hypothetical protein
MIKHKRFKLNKLLSLILTLGACYDAAAGDGDACIRC